MVYPICLTDFLVDTPYLRTAELDLRQVRVLPTGFA